MSPRHARREESSPSSLTAAPSSSSSDAPRAAGPGRRRRPGEQSAGRVLGIVVVALVLAALVNADALVERAERKPLGAGRDRSLALWHPVQDLSHVLQLHRLRDLAEAITGADGRGAPRAESAAPATTTTARGGATTTTEPPRRPELRTPTAAEPLRLWAGGDSMMRDLSESIQRLAAEDPRYATTVHYEISTGLTRPDYYDWPAALAADLADTDPEVMMIMFGANDAQGIVTADGTVFQRVTDAGWQAEYAGRVEATMDLLRDRLVLWVLQPPMRDGDFDARMRILDRIYREAAEGRPWIEIVETAALVGDADGNYRADLRQDDGIHLSRSGADALARALLDRVEDEFAVGGAATTSTTRQGSG